MHDFFFINHLSLTHLTYQVLKKKTSKKNRVTTMVENKLEVYKVVKNNVLKYFIMEQFSIGRLTF